MANIQPYRIKTLKEYHLLMGLPKPEHPLISVVLLDSIRNFPVAAPTNVVFDFYSISLKRNFNGKMKYGQQKYDFDDGIMFFMAPGQVFGIEVGEGEELKHSGWVLFIHPDFLWNTTLAKTIKQYEYFDYSVNEALYLSEKEEATIINIMQNVEQEYRSNIDKFSQDIIIALIEVLLNYSERFYHSNTLETTADIILGLNSLYYYGYELNSNLEDITNTMELYQLKPWRFELEPYKFLTDKKTGMYSPKEENK